MESPVSKNLVYTVAFDPPGCSGHRNLAKMLVSSLLKTYFSGDIMIFRNTETPLFLVGREGLREVYVETPEPGAASRSEYAMCWKYRAADWIDASQYDRILFLDSDCLVLRNIDHLLKGDWDILYKPETDLRITNPQFNCFLTDSEMGTLARDGINSGTWAVRGSLFPEVMREWERIGETVPLREHYWSDQPAWNRLLLDTALRAVPFGPGEVQFPMYQDQRFPKYSKAAITHNLGGSMTEKLHFTFGLYMQNFYCDPSALFLQFLEV